ncbi:UNKNOWN [Stylonychia lemnae]|uniref:Uncharacterized protein n=1 Tax=Stylonychia lemnae TaxID=5949 RepID=A0A078AZJ3_STYLE|nr:UNKNOWN [Stylonychia lemnae]|eukprot:CDW86228.1 UNKNOWN [Stylonychia lemnae]
MAQPNQYNWTLQSNKLQQDSDNISSDDSEDAIISDDQSEQQRNHVVLNGRKAFKGNWRHPNPPKENPLNQNESKVIQPKRKHVQIDDSTLDMNPNQTVDLTEANLKILNQQAVLLSYINSPSSNQVSKVVGASPSYEELQRINEQIKALLPKSTKTLDSRNKRFLFRNDTNDLSTSNLDINISNKKIDLDSFFKRLQQDIDRRKLSNDRRAQQVEKQKEDKLKNECTFTPERSRSKLSKIYEDSLQQKKQNKSKKEKKKNELNATTIVMTTKQLRQANLEAKKNPKINKNTDAILWHKFEYEWNHVVKDYELTDILQFNFDQFIQVMLGFRFIKHYNDDQKKLEFQQTQILTDLFNEVAGVDVKNMNNTSKRNLRNTSLIDPVKLKLNVMKLMNVKQPINKDDDQSTAADIEEQKRPLEINMSTLLSQPQLERQNTSQLTANVRDQFRVRFKQLIQNRDENLQYERQMQLKIKHKEEKPTFKPKISEKSNQIFQKLVNQSELIEKQSKENSIMIASTSLIKTHTTKSITPYKSEEHFTFSSK